MKLKRIDCCSDYFGYGKISNSIIAESFIWDEEEFVTNNAVLEHIKNNYTYSRIYFFTSRYCPYPLSFRDKNWGLWKNLKQETGFLGTQQQEFLFQLNRYARIVGITQVPENQINMSLDLLKRDFMYSFIYFAFSDSDLSLSDNSFHITDSDFSLNFSEIINQNCNNGVLATAVIGSNGTTINFFHSGK